MLTLLPTGGTEVVNENSARYLRKVIRTTVQAGLFLYLLMVTMPLVGYPEPAIQPVLGLFLTTCVLGLLGVLMRQRTLLDLIGPEDSTRRLVIVLRNSVRRLYPLLMLAALGMMLTASAADLIAVFLGLELASLPLWALSALGRAC